MTIPKKALLLFVSFLSRFPKYSLTAGLRFLVDACCFRVTWGDRCGCGAGGGRSASRASCGGARPANPARRRRWRLVRRANAFSALARVCSLTPTASSSPLPFKISSSLTSFWIPFFIYLPGLLLELETAAPGRFGAAWTADLTASEAPGGSASGSGTMSERSCWRGAARALTLGGARGTDQDALALSRNQSAGQGTENTFKEDGGDDIELGDDQEVVVIELPRSNSRLCSIGMPIAPRVVTLLFAL